MASRGDVELLAPIASYDGIDPEPDEDLIEQAAALLGNAEHPPL